MEDAKLNTLHDTLKLLAPKGRHGGLGYYAGAAKHSRTAADSMPEGKRLLYSHFVREGEGHVRFNNNNNNNNEDKLATIDAAYAEAAARKAAKIDAAYEAARHRKREAHVANSLLDKKKKKKNKKKNKNDNTSAASR